MRKNILKIWKISFPLGPLITMWIQLLVNWTSITMWIRLLVNWTFIKWLSTWMCIYPLVNTSFYCFSKGQGLCSLVDSQMIVWRCQYLTTQHIQLQIATASLAKQSGQNESLLWLNQFPSEKVKIHKDENIIFTLADNYLYVAIIIKIWGKID